MVFPIVSYIKTNNLNFMDQKRVLLVIPTSDISNLSLNEIDTESDSFKDMVYNHLSENYGIIPGEVAIHVENDTIFIEWIPKSESDIEEELERAMQIISDGDLEDAKRVLEDLDIRYPDDPIVLYNLGMCYSDLGNLNFAIDSLSKCVKLIPVYSNAHVALGVAYARKGMLDESEINLRKAIELDKKNPFAYRNLASILGNKGDYASSAENFKFAYDLDPENPYILYGLGLSNQNLGNKTDAAIYYEKLIDIGAPKELVKLAKEGLNEISHEPLKTDNSRPESVFYCLSAIEKFEHMDIDEIKQISFEIATKGMQGLDMDSLEKKYTLNSLKGEFSGFILVCYMYVGFQIIEPTLDIGIDLSKEYNSAKQMHKMNDHKWN